MVELFRKTDSFYYWILFLWLGALFNIAWKLPYLSGDAIIHLIFAQNMACGHPLEFNPGQIVAGSTSPFWTLLISLFFRFFSPSVAAVLLKACGLTLFGWTTALVAHLFRKTAGPAFGFGAALLWAYSAGIAINAIEGMENVFFSFLMLSIILFLSEALVNPRIHFIILLGFISAAAFLTRPEGLLAICICLAAFTSFRTRYYGKRLAVMTAAYVAAAALVILLWYSFFFALVNPEEASTSMLSRYLQGRLHSIQFGPLWIHPKVLIRFLAYMPVILGAAVMFWKRCKQRWRRFLDPGCFDAGAGHLAIDAGLGIVLAAFVFYTFFVGAHHATRYLLFVFPYLFGVGLVGFFSVIEGMRHKGWKWAFLLFCSIWMLGAYYAERRLRVSMSRGHHLLDVMGMVNRRRQVTDALLQQLGHVGPLPVRVALTEVQIRYQLDDRVWINGLDGRTDNDLIASADKVTGCPDYAEYFRKARPDYVFNDQLPNCSDFAKFIQSGALKNSNWTWWQDIGFKQVSDIIVKLSYGRDGSPGGHSL